MALVFASTTLRAQDEGLETPPDVTALQSPGVSMTDDEARKTLATALPAEAPLQQRLDLLLRHAPRRESSAIRQRSSERSNNSPRRERATRNGRAG